MTLYVSPRRDVYLLFLAEYKITPVVYIHNSGVTGFTRIDYTDVII